MREQCDAHMRAACARTCDAKCHVTERYGTERKSIQDTAANPSVSNAAGPVDNPKFNRFIELDTIGWGAKNIAAELGVTQRTITRWRASAGRLRRPAQTTHTNAERQQALNLIRGGAPFTEAAATIGVTNATIRRWFPDEPAWTKSQSGEYAVMVRRLNKILTPTETPTKENKK